MKKIDKAMKKIIIIILCFTLLSSNIVFSFEEPNWGALLEEKRNFVGNVELDLYAQGDMENALYYGAKNEQISGVYFGMIAEETEGIQHPISSYLTYFDLESHQDDIYYPANQLIENDNVITTIGWTVSSVDNIEEHIDTIRAGLNNLAKYDKPMFIRFANEMNVSSIGDNPEQYKEVFRIVADMVHEYDNFATVWSPNDIGALDRPFDYYYPGDEYVDWLGISCYMKPYFLGNPDTSEIDSIYFMTGSYAWATNAVKPIIDFMEKNNIQKPLMISEGGVANETSNGEDFTWWAQPRLRNMYYYLAIRYPQIKLINYFNKKMSYEAQYYNISHKDSLTEILNEALDSGAYIREYGQDPQFTFIKANEADVLSGDLIPLYTYAYVPGKDFYSVSYYIDGEFYHSSDTIPYKCNFNPNDFADGQYSLDISLIADGNQIDVRKYVFYKKGNSVFIRDDGIQINPDDMPEFSENITVKLDNKVIDFDVLPILKNDRTLVPFRRIFEELKADIDWVEETSTVIGTKGNINIRLKINSEIAVINGEEYKLDVPAMLVDGRTMVPLRFIAESMGVDVDWDGESNTVLIKTK